MSSSLCPIEIDIISVAVWLRPGGKRAHCPCTSFANNKNKNTPENWANGFAREVAKCVISFCVIYSLSGFGYVLCLCEIICISHSIQLLYILYIYEICMLVKILFSDVKKDGGKINITTESMHESLHFIPTTNVLCVYVFLYKYM